MRAEMRRPCARTERIFYHASTLSPNPSPIQGEGLPSPLPPLWTLMGKGGVIKVGVWRCQTPTWGQASRLRSQELDGLYHQSPPGRGAADAPLPHKKTLMVNPISCPGLCGFAPLREALPGLYQQSPKMGGHSKERIRMRKQRFPRGTSGRKPSPLER